MSNFIGVILHICKKSVFIFHLLLLLVDDYNIYIVDDIIIILSRYYYIIQHQGHHDHERWHDRLARSVRTSSNRDDRLLLYQNDIMRRTTAENHLKARSC